ncbi:hypothetical protein GCM10025795_35800 [Verticiella sediminum]
MPTMTSEASSSPIRVEKREGRELKSMRLRMGTGGLWGRGVENDDTTAASILAPAAGRRGRQSKKVPPTLAADAATLPCWYG